MTLVSIRPINSSVSEFQQNTYPKKGISVSTFAESPLYGCSSARGLKHNRYYQSHDNFAGLVLMEFA